MTKPFLSVIIPTYNDAERLPLTLIDVDRHLSGAEFSYEILVVNDASTDRTRETVLRLEPVAKNLKLIDNPTHRGRGAAVKLGILAAKGNWRLIFDPANSISIVEFNKILPALTANRGIHVLAASRRSHQTTFEGSEPIAHRALEWITNRAAKTILQTRTRDFLLGFHCFSEEAAERIFSSTRSEALGQSIEALALGEYMGYPVQEVPVSVSDRSGGAFPVLADYLQMLIETIRIRWWMSRGKYKRAH
ncbi:MAG: glycosyltransferase [Patescibacteria group bacterium]